MRCKELKWYAFMHDFNDDKLIYTNVLCVIDEKIQKQLKKMTTYEEVKNKIKTELIFRFWCRAEYEVLVTDLHYKPERDNEFKIDVWYQLEPNLDRITEYVIKELKLKVGE